MKVAKVEMATEGSIVVTGGGRGWLGFVSPLTVVSRTRSSHAANMSHFDWHTIIISHTDSVHPNGPWVGRSVRHSGALNSAARKNIWCEHNVMTTHWPLTSAAGKILIFPCCLYLLVSVGVCYVKFEFSWGRSKEFFVFFCTSRLAAFWVCNFLLSLYIGNSSTVSGCGCLNTTSSYDIISM